MAKVLLKSTQVKSLKKSDVAEVAVAKEPIPVVKPVVPPMTVEQVAEDMGYKFSDAIRQIKCYRDCYIRCTDATTKNLLLRLLKVKKAEASLLQNLISYASGIDNDNDVDGGEF